MRTISLNALLLGLVLSLSASAASIDPAARYAWSPAIASLDLAPANGGVIVSSSHLAGYAYNANTGWISLGSHTDTADYTYLNTAAGNYGVNNDGSGLLSGYAWSSSIGWVQFDPANGGVSIDPHTGLFSGYAYNPNIGWIAFSGTAQNAETWAVATTWRPLATAIVDNGPGAQGTLKPGLHILNNPATLQSGKAEFVVAVSGPSEIVLRIFDPLGTLVDEQKDLSSSAGEAHRFVWDLKNREGGGVGAGSYLAVASVRDRGQGSITAYKVLVWVQ